LVAVSVRIGSGATLVGVANLISTLSLFAVSVTIGRLAGATNLGRYGLLVVVGSFFGGIIDFGTDRILTERLAQRSPGWIAAWWGVVVVKGSTLGPGLVIGLLVLAVDHVGFVLLVAIQGASLTATLTTQAMAVVLHRLPALALVRVGTRMMALAGIAVVVAFHVDLGSIVSYSIVLVSIADLSGAALLGAYVFRPDLTKLDRDDWNQASIWAAVRAGLPLGVSSLAVWLYLKLDTVILAGVSDLSTLGTYTAAVRLAELLGGIPTALYSVTLTALAELWAGDARRFRFARDALLTATTISMGLVCMIVFLLATPIAGATYHLPNAALYLRLLVWGQVFAAAGVISGASLQVSKKNSAVAHIALLVALVSIPTYTFLIAFFGASGAAIATTALYTAILPIGLLLPATRETFLPLLVDAAILILCLLAAFVALIVAQRNGPIPIAIQVPLASVAYVAVAACSFLLMVARNRRIETT